MKRRYYSKRRKSKIKTSKDYKTKLGKLYYIHKMRRLGFDYEDIV